MTVPVSRGRVGRRALPVMGVVILALAAAYAIALASTGHSQLARTIVWLEADVDDLERFPSRLIEAADAAPLPTALDQSTVEAFARIDRDLTTSDDLDAFLTGTDTSAFLVLSDGVLVNEWYGDGAGPESLHTSFSMAKSFVSTLIGIAIADGAIGSIDDAVTDYVPELLDRDPRFADVTLEHLLTMSSGIAYTELGTPWSDDATTYYAPDLRSAALETAIAEAPGDAWLYNNYNPLLLGIVLERATGETVADFMSRVLWKPLGAEADASWSIDSLESGFEKMESGVNARAIDYARFGQLIANGGFANGEQVVPRQWVRDATARSTTGDPAEHYQYFWWVFPRAGAAADYAARGNFGQYIYVAPEEGIVIVRLGRTTADIDWPVVLAALAREFEENGRRAP